MPSYAQEVKNELSRKLDDDRGCQLAEFVALLKVGAKKIDGRLEFSGSNAAVARKVITLGKKFLPSVKPEVAAIRRKKLLKNLCYVVRFILSGEVQKFFDEPDFDELLRQPQFKAAYLRGAFLAKGSVNRPESNYLLTIPTTEVQGHFIRQLLDDLEFGGGLSRRKKDFLVWLREADTICDFMGMVGANEALERFEIARNVKEVRLQVSRVVNMETAALNKSIDAANRQLADILFLLEENVFLSKRLREAMLVRLENPTGTVAELAAQIPMSRRGLLYRFKVIHDLADLTRAQLRREAQRRQAADNDKFHNKKR